MSPAIVKKEGRKREREREREEKRETERERQTEREAVESITCLLYERKVMSPQYERSYCYVLYSMLCFNCGIFYTTKFQKLFGLILFITFSSDLSGMTSIRQVLQPLLLLLLHRAHCLVFGLDSKKIQSLPQTLSRHLGCSM